MKSLIILIFSLFAQTASSGKFDEDVYSQGVNGGEVNGLPYLFGYYVLLIFLVTRERTPIYFWAKKISFAYYLLICVWITNNSMDFWIAP